MLFELPSSVEFGGRRWAIRTDYRDVLRVLAAFADPDLTDGEKAYVCLRNMYPAFEHIPPRLAQAALTRRWGSSTGRRERTANRGTRSVLQGRPCRGERVLRRPHPPLSGAPSPEGKARGTAMGSPNGGRGFASSPGRWTGSRTRR